MPDFTTLIQEWYRLNKRDLPWRNENDPYKIWISEVILQQTQVIQGLDYYLKFESTFPNVKTLANANQQDVLNLWQGLGYYSRARNMHFAAQQVMDEFNGDFPKTYNTLLKLKGVGEYTAAAVSSIAFNLPHAVVDGNVFRVLSRVFEIETAINTPKGKKEFTVLANDLLDKKNPGTHNQALMEIGALVCKPKNPNCNECPLSSKCLSFKNNSALKFPVKEKKLKVKERTIDYLVVSDKEKVVIKKREGKDIWQGLYDFPILDKQLSEKEKMLDVSIKHILTHQKITANFWLADLKGYHAPKNTHTVSLNNLEDYPMPTLIIKYFKLSNYFNN